MNAYWQYTARKSFNILSSIRKIPIVVMLPIVILAAFIILAIFAPLIAPYSPTIGNLSDRLMPPAWVEGGSQAYLLGTDFMGRDVLSRLIYGARISLTMGLLAIFLAGSIGTIIGMLSGYLGGYIDELIMRLTEMALSMPLILMAILLVVVFGASYTNVILVIVLLLWPQYARQIRGETLSIRERDFVALAKIAGCSHLLIIWKHILPNVFPTLLVLATLQVGYVIILEATLSFLGVGIPKPTPAWGVMVADAQGLIDSAWWIALFPGLAILLLVLSLNLFGDWLRDRLDPKLRQI